MTDGAAATTSHPSPSAQVNHFLQLLNDAMDPLESKSFPGSSESLLQLPSDDVDCLTD